MSAMTVSRRGALIGFDLVSGAADSDTTGLAVSDADGNSISTDDEIIAIIELAQTTNAHTDRTAHADTGIIAGGKITVAASANDTIAVWWMKNDPAYNEGQIVDSPYIRAEVVNGTTADTNIAVSGSHTTDVLVSAVEVNATSGAWTDRTATTSFTSDGYIQCTDDTSSNQIFLIWIDTNYAIADSAVCYKFGYATMGLSDESDITLSGLTTSDSILVCVAFDETDYDALDAIQPDEITITATNTFRIDQVSPTVTASSKLFVIWHDRQQ